MEQNSKVFAKSNQEGIDRVLKDDGLYAFMMESTVSQNLPSNVHANWLPRNVHANYLHNNVHANYLPSKVYDNSLLSNVHANFFC